MAEKIETKIENIKRWILKIQAEYHNLINIETIANEEKFYRVILQINSSMAEIVIADDDFAPYNNIAFQIVEIKNDKVNMLYCWYDNEQDDMNSIIQHLNEGLMKVLSIK